MVSTEGQLPQVMHEQLPALLAHLGLLAALWGVLHVIQAEQLQCSPCEWPLALLVHRSLHSCSSQMPGTYYWF